MAESEGEGESITIVRPAGRREEEKQGRVRSAGLLSRALGGAWTGGIGRAGSTGDGGESWDGRLAGTYTSLNVQRQRRGVHCRSEADRPEGETSS
jgi:hypothetical protein